MKKRKSAAVSRSLLIGFLIFSMLLFPSCRRAEREILVDSVTLNLADIFAREDFSLRDLPWFTDIDAPEIRALSGGEHKPSGRQQDIPVSPVGVEGLKEKGEATFTFYPLSDKKGTESLVQVNLTLPFETEENYHGFLALFSSSLSSAMEKNDKIRSLAGMSLDEVMENFRAMPKNPCACNWYIPDESDPEGIDSYTLWLYSYSTTGAYREMQKNKDSSPDYVITLKVGYRPLPKEADKDGGK